MVIIELIYTTFKFKNAFVWVSHSLGTIIQTPVKMKYGEITNRKKQRRVQETWGIDANYLIFM